MDSNNYNHKNKTNERENYFSECIKDQLTNVVPENYFNIINVSNQFAEDILFIVRSLGWTGVKSKMFSPYVTETIQNTNKNTNTSECIKEHTNNLLREMDELYKVELYFPNYEEIDEIPLRDKNKTKEWIHEIAKDKIRKDDLTLYNIKVS